MKIVFFGTAPFSIPFLEALNNRHTVSKVVTRSAKPKGRDLKVLPSEVKIRALELGLGILEPEDLRDTAFLEELKSAGASLGIVAAYGRIMPPEVMTVFKDGCINVHPSLLPLYRGPAPVQRAVINGEKTTGVSIIAVADEVDSGDIFAMEEIAVGENETAGDVFRKAALAGSRLLLKVIDEIEEGTAAAHPQKAAAATFAPKLEPEETKIDWNRAAPAVHDLIRGLYPKPAAHTLFRGKRLKILGTVKGQEPGRTGRPGELISTGERLFAACGGGSVLEVLMLQPEGKREMTAAEFIRGYHPQAGEHFD